MEILVALVTAPLLMAVGVLVRGALLFWPTMILLGAVHSHLPWVPALGWSTTFLVVALLGLLLPTDGGGES